MFACFSYTCTKNFARYVVKFYCVKHYCVILLYILTLFFGCWKFCFTIAMSCSEYNLLVCSPISWTIKWLCWSLGYSGGQMKDEKLLFKAVEYLSNRLSSTSEPCDDDRVLIGYDGHFRWLITLATIRIKMTLVRNNDVILSFNAKLTLFVVIV